MTSFFEIVFLLWVLAVIGWLTVEAITWVKEKMDA